MNGVIYPEITDMTGAQIGGYLSDTAASQLKTFGDKAAQPRYKYANYTCKSVKVEANNTSTTVAYTPPSGYEYVGATGYHLNMRGWAGTSCNSTTGRVYCTGGSYTNETIAPVIQILFHRT